jgi:protease-4
MRIRSWEALVTIIFLIVCLLAGLGLAEFYAPKPIIGVVRFGGLIDPASAQQMAAILDAARDDDRIAGVTMEISSPGGDVGSTEKLYHTMLQLRQRKPVVVAIDGIAASGGYYMAVAGNKIYAPASAFVGNVGVRAGRPFDPGISPFELTTGPYKLSGGSRFDSIRQLELMKEAFVGSVVHQRSRSPYNPLRVDASTVAEAHLYLGSEALAIGLIDAQGSRSDAILATAELAGIKKYRVLELTDYLDLVFEPNNEVRDLIDNALPGTVFLLDSRIPLAGNVRGRLERDSLYPMWGESNAPTQGQSDPSPPFDLTEGSRQ